MKSETKDVREYKQAPLPFQGQKRNFLGPFKTALAEFVEQAGVHTVVDLFGGSGLLSHIAKSMFPELRVIYNDFDGFSERLSNVDRTNLLLDKIREVVKNEPRGKIITGPVRDRVIDLVRKGDESGYVDYITLSGSLLFSCNYAKSFQELVKQGFYNNVKKEPYRRDVYLQGVETVCENYKTLFDQFKGQESVLFVVDPPYLSTDVRSYNSQYWKLRDYLDVLDTLYNNNYIFFTSDKSQILELCDWFAERCGFDSPLSNARLLSYRVKGKTTNYTDIMLYKKK